MPNLLRRVAALTLISAVGIALRRHWPCSPRVRRAMPPPPLSLDAASTGSTLDRGAPGREQLSALTLIDQRRAAPESFVTNQRPLPTPGSAPMEATLYVDRPRHRSLQPRPRS